MHLLDVMYPREEKVIPAYRSVCLHCGKKPVGKRVLLSVYGARSPRFCFCSRECMMEALREALIGRLETAVVRKVTRTLMRR